MLFFLKRHVIAQSNPSCLGVAVVSAVSSSGPISCRFWRSIRPSLNEGAGEGAGSAHIYSTQQQQVALLDVRGLLWKFQNLYRRSWGWSVNVGRKTSRGWHEPGPGPAAQQTFLNNFAGLLLHWEDLLSTPALSCIVILDSGMLHVAQWRSHCQCL